MFVLTYPFSVQTAKTRWHNLRGSYSRSRRFTNLPNGSDTPDGSKPTFYLANQMNFLEPYMAQRPSTGRLGTSATTFVSEDDDGDESLDNHLTSSPPLCLSPASVNHVPIAPTIAITPTSSTGQTEPDRIHSSRRKRRASSPEEWKETDQKFLVNPRLELEDQPNDPDMDSLRGFLPHLAQLSGRRKRKFLRYAYNLILSLVDEEEMEREGK